MWTNPTYLTVVAILVFITYISIEDENVLPFINLQFQILLLNIRKKWMLLTMRPQMWLMRRRMERELKKIRQDPYLQQRIKEYQETENASNNSTTNLP